MGNLKYKNYDHILKMEPDELLQLKRKNGLALSLIGDVAYRVLASMNYQPKYFYDIFSYFEIGQGWGGISLGWLFVCCEDAPESLKCHEVGHTIQNANLGGWKMIALCLASVARYWYRKIFGAKTPYDSWWFEGQATELGTKYVEIRKNKM
jgi:hypothetical protein